MDKIQKFLLFQILQGIPQNTTPGIVDFNKICIGIGNDHHVGIHRKKVLQLFRLLFTGGDVDDQHGKIHALV